MVRIISGEVFDVAVKFTIICQMGGALLSAQNKKQLWIPAGFAYGFLFLADLSKMLYKTSDYYAPKLERSILWSDPEIAIEWSLVSEIKIASKDEAGSILAQAEVYI